MKFTSYSDCIDFLFKQLPMYQRVGEVAMKKDLTNITELLRILDNPHRRLKCIHVAGTNGKGSTSHLIASIMQTKGLKIGLYTSPHLKDFRERIRLNKEMISESDILNFVNQYITEIQRIKPSFFEITVAMAFWYFAQKEVDYAIIETGLGGRLDSTNVVTPLLSVITNISLDHTHMLGESLVEIAIEKAGIIKSNIPVIVGEHQTETDSVFKSKANKLKCDIYFAEDFVEIDSESEYLDVKFDNTVIAFLENGLNAYYQIKNIVTAISSVSILSKSINQVFTTADIKSGIREVISRTGIRGRWETLLKNPLVIADIAHNAAGLTEVFKLIEKLRFKNLHIVLGVVNDKELDKILPLFPTKAIYYFCKPNVPRGLEAKNLFQQAKSYHLHGNVFTSVQKAYQNALQSVDKEDLIYIGGSTFVVAEVL